MRTTNRRAALSGTTVPFCLLPKVARHAMANLIEAALRIPRSMAVAVRGRWREIATGELEAERLLRIAAVSPTSRSSFAPSDALADIATAAFPKIRLPKTVILSALIALALCGSAQGAVYSFSGPFVNNGPGAGVIPDNDYIGLADVHTLSGLGSSISDVILTVHLSGSAIDDLSGYLRLGNLAGSPSVDLAAYLTPGHNDFTVDLTAFNSLNPNNTWTLFFADTSAGGENTLVSWSLDITAVPEPANVALGVFAGVLVLTGVARKVRARKLVRRAAAAETHG